MQLCGGVAVVASQVAVVKEAGLASQQSWFSTLGAIASDLQGIKLSPCVLVVGRVAGLPAAWAGLMQQARQDTQPA
jgi:siroheme synthase